MRATGKLVRESDLRTAWAQAFLQCMEWGVQEISPLVITIGDRDSGGRLVDESPWDELEKALRNNGKRSSQTVANTIFPQSLWNRSTTRTEFYERYKRVLPRLRRYSQYGTYFERLIQYPSNGEPLNQLEFLIAAYDRGVRRRSAFQLALLNPGLDHTFQMRRGFPCLHQVQVLPDRGAQDLRIVAFYALQYVFDRGFGNYLGLLRLGTFLGSQLNLRLTEITCVAAVAKLGDVAKSHLVSLQSALSR